MVSKIELANAFPAEIGMTCYYRPPRRVCLPPSGIRTRGMYLMHGCHHAPAPSRIWPRCKTYRVKGAIVWMRSSTMSKNWLIFIAAMGEKLAVKQGPTVVV